MALAGEAEGAQRQGTKGSKQDSDNMQARCLHATTHWRGKVMRTMQAGGLYADMHPYVLGHVHASRGTGVQMCLFTHKNCSKHAKHACMHAGMHAWWQTA